MFVLLRWVTLNVTFSRASESLIISLSSSEVAFTPFVSVIISWALKPAFQAGESRADYFYMVVMIIWIWHGDLKGNKLLLCIKF